MRSHHVSAHLTNSVIPFEQPRGQRTSTLAPTEARLLRWEYSDPHAEITICVDDVDEEIEVRYVREVAQILRAIRAESVRDANRVSPYTICLKKEE